MGVFRAGSELPLTGTDWSRLLTPKASNPWIWMRMLQVRNGDACTRMLMLRTRTPWNTRYELLLVLPVLTMTSRVYGQNRLERRKRKSETTMENRMMPVVPDLRVVWVFGGQETPIIRTKPLTDRTTYQKSDLHLDTVF